MYLPSQTFDAFCEEASGVYDKEKKTKTFNTAEHGAQSQSNIKYAGRDLMQLL